jgi:hypothetical protein
MKNILRHAFLRQMLAVWCLVVAGIPVAAQTTNTLLFNFASFGVSSPVYSVTLQAVQPQVINGVFYSNPKQQFGAVAYTNIGNGFLVVTSQVANVVMWITISGEQDWTTNYCIPPTAPTNSAGQVVAGNWVGTWNSQNNQFYWSSPIVTNINVNSGGGFNLGQSVSGSNGATAIQVVGVDASGLATTNPFPTGGSVTLNGVITGVGNPATTTFSGTGTLPLRTVAVSSGDDKCHCHEYTITE